MFRGDASTERQNSIKSKKNAVIAKEEEDKCSSDSNEEEKQPEYNDENDAKKEKLLRSHKFINTGYQAYKNILAVYPKIIPDPEEHELSLQALEDKGI